MKHNVELETVLSLLKQKELHVRGIAKSVSEPHANISRQMKSLLEKNIVDFRVQGKNKLFRLKKGVEALSFIYMAEHYELLKLVEKYPLLSIIIESILAKTDAKLIILFGSYAKLNAKKDSDIDLFIETKDSGIKKEIERINSGLSVKIGVFDTEDLLIREIIKHHVILRGVEYYYQKHKAFD